MHFIPIALLSLSIGALAGCPNVQKRDDRPGGAAAIESAVNSLYAGTNLPSNLATLEPALSSAGVTGVVVSDTTYGTSQPTGTGQGNNDNNGNNDGGNNGQGGQNDNGQGNSDNNNDQGNSDNNANGNDNDNDDGSNQNNDNNQNSGTSTYDGLAAATSVPQVLMAGGFGAVGMAVLGML